MSGLLAVLWGKYWAIAREWLGVVSAIKRELIINIAHIAAMMIRDFMTRPNCVFTSLDALVVKKVARIMAVD